MITDFPTCSSPDHPEFGIKMQIIFKRRLTNEVLTTYLPTVLLIIIGYCTTFFKPFFFEAALTVNVTTMLVMTTIFISVMEKLPPTSYIRMVDIWLIFGILIPFLEVSILTFKEYMNDESLAFNHHSRMIEVENVSKSIFTCSPKTSSLQESHDEETKHNNFFAEQKINSKKMIRRFAAILGKTFMNV